MEPSGFVMTQSIGAATISPLYAFVAERPVTSGFSLTPDLPHSRRFAAAVLPCAR